MTTAEYHLVDEEGEAFFWLADTAWNLWARGTEEEWDRYLAKRKQQGFTAIQFVAGWWRGCMEPRWGRAFDVREGKVVYDEEAWASVGRLFGKIRDHGLAAAPVCLWTLTDIDPGQVLSEDQCIEVARRQVEEWNGPNVVWLLGGDGDYRSPEVAERWKRIGRAVAGERTDVMATLHPCGTSWPVDDFAGEPWYRLAAIQSGHGSSEADLRFLVEGDYASSWKRNVMPHLNLEPNYEDARSYGERLHLTDYHVRRASWWSLLLAPPAGVTYGIGSIWMWATEAGEIAENHDESWVGQPWHTQMETPGVACLQVLRSVFARLPWTELRPAPESLASQPGQQNPRAWQALAISRDGGTALAYSPAALPVQIRDAEDWNWQALDPRTGEDLDVHCGAIGVFAETLAGDFVLIGRR